MHNDGHSSLHELRWTDKLSEGQRKELDRIEAEMQATLGAAEPDCPYTAGANALDRQAIDDEHAFIRRFGFDWPRTDRIGVIALKHRFDLTDREIRLLKRTGNLKPQRGLVTLTSARTAAIFGRCLAVVMLVEFVLLMLLELAAMHYVLSALQVVRLYGVTASVIGMVWLVHLGYIKPWIIEQRVMGTAGIIAE